MLMQTVLGKEHLLSIVCDVDFAKENLEKANFKDTDLLGSMFGDINLKDTDLITAINYMINPSNNYIKGTKISLPQASSFLHYFDLEVVN